MQTRQEFFEEYKQDIGEEEFNSIFASIDKEYYSMIENEVKQGNVISKSVYDSLPDMQKFHFNKHYNHRNDKIA